MNFEAFTLIVISAVLHATWNFFTKRAVGNKVATLWTGWLIAGLITTPISLYATDLSEATHEWIPLLFLTVVVHAMYIYLLGWAYSLGEMSLIYPIARGIGILLTVIIVIFTGMEIISAKGLFGIFVLVCGIFFIAIKRFRDLEKRNAMIVAAMVGGCTSYYTIIDKISVMNIPPFFYISLMFLFSPILLSPLMFTKLRTQTIVVLRNHKFYSALIGFVTMFTYTLILFALQTSSTPYVAALREVSIVFASILGIMVLKEESNKRKLMGIVMIIIGAIIIKLA